jgi:hypothetical protein
MLRQRPISRHQRDVNKPSTPTRASLGFETMVLIAYGASDERGAGFILKDGSRIGTLVMGAGYWGSDGLHCFPRLWWAFVEAPK